MILGENIGSVYSNGREIQRVFSKGKLVWEKESGVNYHRIPFTVQAIDDKVSVKISQDFKYSINGGEWVQTFGGDTIDLSKDDTVRIISTENYRCIITGLSDVYGNIMSLVKGDKFINQFVWTYSYPVYTAGMFQGCDIRSGENLILPATTLVEYCYQYMFRDCTALTTAPELPATTLARGCYDGMFYGCTALTTAPELPATTLARLCYNMMFGYCSSLTTAPELPATTLAEYCYQYMFCGCTALTTAPELPATTLVEGCYSLMLCGCTALTTAPELPATTLAEYCYDRMFNGCTALTTAPELPATTLVEGCYGGMFYKCEVLSYIKCYASDVAKGTVVRKCFETDIPIDGYVLTVRFTEGVSPTGKIVCNESFSTKLSKYIPSTWTVEYLN